MCFLTGGGRKPSQAIVLAVVVVLIEEVQAHVTILTAAGKTASVWRENKSECKVASGE